ncbi:hypothetical protein PoB_005480800 [Plakobranchus ocellatus]|uniref:Uncharacterized protein n=1 Tax=Plakobranchus ocellatus TaxID=259542 RepID=A0AAV4CBC3_9GAST|nr:hypothetical protein PoB_005480800 [Plakobranchus ocellatus]
MVPNDTWQTMANLALVTFIFQHCLLVYGSEDKLFKHQDSQKSTSRLGDQGGFRHNINIKEFSSNRNKNSIGLVQSEASLRGHGEDQSIRQVPTTISNAQTDQLQSNVSSAWSEAISDLSSLESPSPSNADPANYTLKHVLFNQGFTVDRNLHKAETEGKKEDKDFKIDYKSGKVLQDSGVHSIRKLLLRHWFHPNSSQIEQSHENNTILSTISSPKDGRLDSLETLQSHKGSSLEKPIQTGSTRSFIFEHHNSGNIASNNTATGLNLVNKQSNESENGNVIGHGESHNKRFPKLNKILQTELFKEQDSNKAQNTDHNVWTKYNHDPVTEAASSLRLPLPLPSQHDGSHHSKHQHDQSAEKARPMTKRSVNGEFLITGYLDYSDAMSALPGDDDYENVGKDIVEFLPQDTHSTSINGIIGDRDKDYDDYEEGDNVNSDLSTLVRDEQKNKPSYRFSFKKASLGGKFWETPLTPSVSAHLGPRLRDEDVLKSRNDTPELVFAVLLPRRTTSVKSTKRSRGARRRPVIRRRMGIRAGNRRKCFFQQLGRN